MHVTLRFAAAVVTALTIALQVSTDAVVHCGGNATCPDGNTCCPTGIERSGAGGWACCADEEPGKGVCCGDGRHCCANGYSCELDTSECVADQPRQHPLAQQTNLYALCPAVIPAEPFELAGLAAGSPLTLPYYASPGPLGGEPNSDALMAVVVVHGSARNADE